ncbi:MAG TPA: hypothetical protein PLM74_09425, partial [Bacillota bacterium]|nr:hypothetical protein [Bacillota bacterium]
PARAVIIAGRDSVLKRLLVMPLHHLHAEEVRRFCISGLPFSICTSVSFRPSPTAVSRQERLLTMHIRKWSRRLRKWGRRERRA